MKLWEVIKVEYHDALCPKLWDGHKLKRKVRNKLLEIAHTFIEYVDLDIKVKDIIFLGSLTNYNYRLRPPSDIDIHILVDSKQIRKKFPKLDEYFKDKKTLFEEHYGIKIYGFPVEVMIEEIGSDRENHSATMFSLMKDKWLKEPEHTEPKIDLKRAQRKVKQWKDEISDAIKKNDADELDKLKDKIADERRQEIKWRDEHDKDVESGYHNIAFKSIRASGLLGRIKKAKRKKEADKLSLK